MSFHPLTLDDRVGGRATHSFRIRRSVTFRVVMSARVRSGRRRTASGQSRAGTGGSGRSRALATVAALACPGSSGIESFACWLPRAGFVKISLGIQRPDRGFLVETIGLEPMTPVCKAEKPSSRRLQEIAVLLPDLDVDVRRLYVSAYETVEDGYHVRYGRSSCPFTRLAAGARYPAPSRLGSSGSLTGAPS
jgi:hypothetical protein